MIFEKYNGKRIKALQFIGTVKSAEKIIHFSNYDFNSCRYNIPDPDKDIARLIIKESGVKQFFVLEEGYWLVRDGIELYTLPDSSIKTFYKEINKEDNINAVS